MWRRAEGATISVRSHETLGPCIENLARLAAAEKWKLLVHPTEGTGRAFEPDPPFGEAASGILDLAYGHEVSQRLLSKEGAAAGRKHTCSRGLRSVPRVVAPGAAGFWSCEADNLRVPFSLERKRYKTLPGMEYLGLSTEEMTIAGRVTAWEINEIPGVVAFLVPMRGFFALTGPQGPLHDPEGEAAFVAALRRELRPEIPLIEIHCHINDSQYAEAAIAILRNALVADRELALAQWMASGLS